MEQAGEPPDTFVGTSAGALNAVVLAAFAGGPPPNVPPELELGTVTDALRIFWSQLRAHQVWRPLLRDAPRVLWYYGGGGIIGGAGLTSLLHTGPLSRTAERWSWALDAAREKIAAGRVKALAVATTDVYRGRTVVFVERARGVALPPTDAKRGIDYVATELTTDHLVASAAIPVAFPAIALPHPSGGSRWYSDGGVRLNAPLKPALALGADRLVVVATHPAEAVDDTASAPDELQPQVDDQLVNVLEAVLVDRMVEDLSTLRKINAAVRQASPSGPSLSGADGRPGSGSRRRLPRVPARVRRSAEPRHPGPARRRRVLRVRAPAPSAARRGGPRRAPQAARERGGAPPRRPAELPVLPPGVRGGGLHAGRRGCRPGGAGGRRGGALDHVKVATGHAASGQQPREPGHEVVDDVAGGPAGHRRRGVPVRDLLHLVGEVARDPAVPLGRAQLGQRHRAST
jgi:predicted acylesterase/phospholipase RssA